MGSVMNWEPITILLCSEGTEVNCFRCIGAERCVVVVVVVEVVVVEVMEVVVEVVVMMEEGEGGGICESSMSKQRGSAHLSTVKAS